MGRPSVFVRLHGCNLRCWFCDTKFDDPNNPVVPVEDLLDQIVDLRQPLVVLTGGEPVRQPLGKLVTRLHAAKKTVQIETAGTLWQDCLSEINIVVSPKTPLIHGKISAFAMAFKYVIRAGEVSDADGLPTMSTQRKGQPGLLARPRPLAPVYLSPLDEYDPEANDRNRQEVFRLALKHGYIAGIQLHKVFGVR